MQQYEMHFKLSPDISVVKYFLIQLASIHT